MRGDDAPRAGFIRHAQPAFCGANPQLRGSPGEQAEKYLGKHLRLSVIIDMDDVAQRVGLGGGGAGVARGFAFHPADDGIAQPQPGQRGLARGDRQQDVVKIVAGGEAQQGGVEGIAAANHRRAVDAEGELYRRIRPHHFGEGFGNGGLRPACGGRIKSAAA